MTAFINTLRPLLVGRRTIRLLTYW